MLCSYVSPSHEQFIDGPLRIAPADFADPGSWDQLSSIAATYDSQQVIKFSNFSVCQETALFVSELWGELHINTTGDMCLYVLYMLLLLSLRDRCVTTNIKTSAMFLADISSGSWSESDDSAALCLSVHSQDNSCTSIRFRSHAGSAVLYDYSHRWNV